MRGVICGGKEGTGRKKGGREPSDITGAQSFHALSGGQGTALLGDELGGATNRGRGGEEKYFFLVKENSSISL